MGLSHQLVKRKLKAFPYKIKTNSGYKVSKYSKKTPPTTNILPNSMLKIDLSEK